MIGSGLWWRRAIVCRVSILCHNLRERLGYWWRYAIIGRVGGCCESPEGEAGVLMEACSSLKGKCGMLMHVYDNW